MKNDYKYELTVENDNRIHNDKCIYAGINTFNSSFVGGMPERYSIYAKDSADNIVGGAIVYAHKKSIYIDVLWVSEVHRGKGVGKKLLANVESEAIKRGILESTLDTFSFQAKDFYKKQGYQHIGTIEKYLEGHDRIYFRKKLI